MAKKKKITKRHIIQWILTPLIPIVIVFGYHFPIISYSAPIVMVLGVLVGFFKGRYVCGNICPRGSFLDRVVSKVSPNNDITSKIRDIRFRWAVFGFMMLFMGFRLFYMGYGDDIIMWEHVGRVFWFMCVVTTAIALILGGLIRPRSWCSFCPMGTLQKTLGGNKMQIKIDKDLCVGCKACEKACPMNLEIVKYKDIDGIVKEPDCIRCSECVNVCPKYALKW